MQCPRCGVISPTGATVCVRCGLPLSTEINNNPPSANSGQGYSPFAPPPPPPINYNFPSTPSSQEAHSAYGTYPPPPVTYSPPLGTYPPPAGYPPPGGYMPPPPSPSPKSRLALVIVPLALVILLVVGAILILPGLLTPKSTPLAPLPKPTLTPTPSPSPSGTPTPNQLYQQVTSKTPTYTDPLTDPATSKWTLTSKPTYGCEIHPDGLHVHISNADEIFYCTSGRGTFTNFALQTDMVILKGAGGGLTFRGDTLAGNYYYFRVYPDGRYTIYSQHNHKAGPELGQGQVNQASVAYGQKNTWTVIAQGHQFFIYLNKNYLTSFQNTAYVAGYIGLLAGAEATPADVAFSNVSIWTA